jgi:hypothetical protein
MCFHHVHIRINSVFLGLVQLNVWNSRLRNRLVSFLIWTVSANIIQSQAGGKAVLRHKHKLHVAEMVPWVLSISTPPQRWKSTKAKTSWVIGGEVTNRICWRESRRVVFCTGNGVRSVLTSRHRNTACLMTCIGWQSSANFCRIRLYISRQSTPKHSLKQYLQMSHESTPKHSP